jgi:hypothetical protein
VCPSGVSSEQVAAAVRIEVSHAIALVLGERGSSLTGHDLEALREGRRTEVDEADLVRLANVCGFIVGSQDVELVPRSERSPVSPFGHLRVGTGSIGLGHPPRISLGWRCVEHGHGHVGESPSPPSCQ